MGLSLAELTPRQMQLLRDRVANSRLVKTAGEGFRDKEILQRAIARLKGSLIAKYWAWQLAEEVSWTRAKVARVMKAYEIATPPTVTMDNAAIAYLHQHPRTGTLAIAHAIAPHISPTNVRECLNRLERRGRVRCLGKSLKGEKIWEVRG